MVYFAGLRGTGSWGTDERPKNFREMILWAEPNGRAPFTALSAKMKSESTDDPEFAWWEEVLKPALVYTNNGAGYNNAATAITVDNGPGTHPTTDTDLTGLQFVAGDLLMIEHSADPASNEIVIVVSTTSTVLTVTRGAAGTTAQAITDNDRITRISSQYEEGSGSPNTVTSNPTKLRNYCEIQKTAYQVTNSAAVTNARTGDPLKNDRKRKMFAHAEKHEMSAIFGRASEATGSGGQPIRSSGGLRSFLSSNVTIFTVDPTEDTFINAIQRVFDWDAGGAGDERVGFIGNTALMFLNRIIRDSTQTRINYDGMIDFFGMNLMKFQLPFGTIGFKSHPLMNVHPRYTSAMFIVNPAGIVRRPLSGRDTKEDKGPGGNGIQAPDADLKKFQWIDEIGMEYHFERTMAYLGEFYDH